MEVVDSEEATPPQAQNGPMDDAQWIADLQTQDLTFDELYGSVQSFAARKGEQG